MIELKNLEKTYRTSKGSVTAIKNINITINDGGYSASSDFREPAKAHSSAV